MRVTAAASSRPTSAPSSAWSTCAGTRRSRRSPPGGHGAEVSAQVECEAGEAGQLGGVDLRRSRQGEWQMILLQ